MFPAAGPAHRRDNLSPMEHAELLIVDDDAELASMVATYLSQFGYRVSTVEDGPAMDQRLLDSRPDLVILDLMLPGEDGLSIARRLAGKLPFIVLSARGEDADRIVGLELGADDYLPKPFNPRELAARIRAVLRRNKGAQPEQHRTLTFGPFLLDISSHTLTRDGVQVDLTTAEFTLLKLLALHPNRVLSREQLVELAHHMDRIPYDRSIDVRIARLRKKIEPDPDKPRYIRTVWGAGYLFAPQGHGE